jgi:serine/threonine protein kinase
VVTKLCREGAHENVVAVLRQGQFPSAFHYIDMELCDLNLETYIKCEWTPLIHQRMPFFTFDLPHRMRLSQAWEIMECITNGVSYIHTNREIHRDLKPRNGTETSV